MNTLYWVILILAFIAAFVPWTYAPRAGIVLLMVLFVIIGLKMFPIHP
jgi:hypothetical protein